MKAHEPIWDDLKRSAEQFSNTRVNVGNSNEDLLADTRRSINSQVAAVTSAWNHLRQEMKAREEALNECLESAQFYADAEEASRWIKEKIHLVEAAGILAQPIETEQELEKAMIMCGPDSSSTMVRDCYTFIIKNVIFNRSLLGHRSNNDNLYIIP